MELPDREVHTYTAKETAEYVYYSQVHPEGHASLCLAEIIRHMSNVSVDSDDDTYITSNCRFFSGELI